MGGAYGSKTFLEVQYRTSGGREVYDSRKIQPLPSRNSEIVGREINRNTQTHYRTNKVEGNQGVLRASDSL